MYVRRVNTFTAEDADFVEAKIKRDLPRRRRGAENAESLIHFTVSLRPFGFPPFALELKEIRLSHGWTLMATDKIKFNIFSFSIRVLRVHQWQKRFKIFLPFYEEFHL